ncbi:MAG: protein phosphatase, partial [Acidimicrobiaceae bacterium]|nr:protein phosphatase [Acidimicrobiaceae bacterium]
IGDRYLLCSDGLFNEVDANTIATILATEADPEVATQKLIAAANEGGGHDNITTVIADVVAAEDASMPSKAQALASLAVVDEGDPTNEQEAIIIEDKAEDDAVEPAVPKQRWSWRR